MRNYQLPITNFRFQPIKVVMIMFVFALLIGATNVFAESMSSPSYRMQSDSVNFGGGNSSSDSFVIEDTAGEVGTGNSASAIYAARAGFQQAIVLAITPTSTPPVIPDTNTPGGSSSSGSRIRYSTTTLNQMINEFINETVEQPYIQPATIPVTPITWVATSSNPFIDLPMATNIDPRIAALTLEDFDFIQDGNKLAVFNDGTIAIDGTKNLTVRLDYDKVPEILKTVAFTLTDPTDESKVFPFVLRVNSDKTAYEATIGALGRSGDYKASVVILDYQNQGLKKLNGSLLASVGVISPSVIEMLSNVGWQGILIAMLIVLVLVSTIIMLIKKRNAKNIVGTVLIFIAIFGIGSIFANAAFNPEINYQGKLFTNDSGTSVPVTDGIYNVRFALYADQTGGSSIWDETATAQVTDGLFSYMLGSTSPLNAVDFNQTLYLGVEIGGIGAPVWDGEMTPRKRLGAVPAAFVAEHSNTASSSDNANYATNAGTSTFSWNAAALEGLSASQFLRSSSTTDDLVQGLVNRYYSDSLFANTFAGTTTSALAEGSNLYFTDSRARDAFSTTAAGLLYATSTGILSLDSNYMIPLFASTTAWDNKVSSQWTSSSTNIYYNGGNVGIGTNAPSDKLEVVGNGNFSGNLTAGNIVTTGMLTVYGDSSLSGSLNVSSEATIYTSAIPPMTSNTAPSPYVASSSSIFNSTYDSWKAFNGIISGNTGWVTVSGTVLGWLSVDLGSAETITRYTVRANTPAWGSASAPRDWTFEGSSDGSIWSILDTEINVTSWSLEEKKTYNIVSPGSYRYYRLNIGANNGYVFTAVIEMELFKMTGANIFYADSSTGNVGIGTTTPSNKLEVAGNGYFAGNLTGANIMATGTLSVAGTTTLSSHLLFSADNSYDIGTFAQRVKKIYTSAFDVGTIYNRGKEYFLTSNSFDSTGSPSIHNNINNLILNAGTAGQSIISYVGGSEAMRINSTGNVGIGTTTPSSKLSVHDSSGLAGTNPLFTIASSTSAGAATTTLFTVLGNGNVGIGTAAPSSKLYLTGTELSNGIKFGDSGDVNIYRGGTGVLRTTSTFILGGYLKPDGNGTAGLPVYTFNNDPDTGLFSPGNNSNRLAFSTGGVERMRIDLDGNFGVGSTTPSSKLSIHDSSGLAGTNPLFIIASSTSAGAATTTLFTVLGNGNVGVGTTNPISSLDVNGSLNVKNGGYLSWGGAYGAGIPVINGVKGASTGYLSFLPAGSSSGEKVRITAAGYLGIGTTTPSAMLHVTGTAGTGDVFAISSSSNSLMFEVTSDGNVLPGADNTYSLGAVGSRWSNIYVGTSTVGDLAFANNFRILEAPADAPIQAMIWRNQHAQDIFTLDENGNLTLPGDICSNNVTCMGKSLSQLSANISSMASSTTVADLALRVSGLEVNVDSNIGLLTSRIAALESIASTSAAFVPSSTVFATTTITTIAQETASSTLNAIATSTSFIQTIATAVQNIIQSTGNWVVDRFTARVAYIDRVETKTICLGSTCIDEEALKKMMLASSVSPVIPVTTGEIIDTGTSTLTITASSTSGTTTPQDIIATSTPVIETTVTSIDTASTTQSVIDPSSAPTISSDMNPNESAPIETTIELPSSVPTVINTETAPVTVAPSPETTNI